MPTVSPSRTACLLASVFLMPCMPSVAAAQGGDGRPAAYDIKAPVYPIHYSESQKDEQRDQGRKLIQEINSAIAKGVKSFLAPPDVYRIPAHAPDNEIKLWKVKGFTLHLAKSELILENGGGLINAEDCDDLSVLGPVKIDADKLTYTQGTLRTYDAATGVATLEIMPGYELTDSPKGTVDAFSTDGVYLENPSWAGYTDAKVVDQAKRLVEVKLGAKDDIFTNIYQPGNLLVLRLHGSPVLLVTRNVRNFTMQDVDLYTGSGFSWGNGTGDWKFLRVRGIPRPGTNRLYGTGGCQRVSYGGSVLFDRCEFSHTTDDLIDYGGGGLLMCVAQRSPREVITWGGEFSVGDTLTFYTSSDFRPIASVKIAAVGPVDDKTLQARAHALCKNVVKARDTDEDRTLRRVTFEQDVQVTAGNFVENSSSQRADTFTMRGCYLHDCAVRVMVQGFKHGLFENNRFERISGGLALTIDAWWWGGPVSQDITVRNNEFDHTTFRNAWGTGKAAIQIGSDAAPADPTQGVAFHRVCVEGNTITDSSTAALSICNASDVTVRNNTIVRPFTLGTPAGAIQLRSVDKAQISKNTITGCPGRNLAVKDSNAVTIRDNRFERADANSGDASKAPKAP